MHEGLFQVAGIRFLVFKSRHPNQAVVVEEKAERVAASNQNVEPHVEFVTLDEERIGDVVLYNTFLLQIIMMKMLFEVNPLSLASDCRFYDETAIFLPFFENFV